MKLVPTKPDANFAVWDFQESQPGATAAPVPDASPASLLRALTHSLAQASGKTLRALTELACELCGAEAAGICMEHEGELVPADTVPIVIASGSCTSLSGAEVPRPQSACAIAMAEGRPKLFQVPVDWLPGPAEDGALAHGMTAPWLAGETRGTLWMLKRDSTAPLGPAEHQTLLTLAALAGISVLNMLDQENCRHSLCVSASDSFTAALSNHVQQPLQRLHSSLERGLSIRDAAARARHLRAVADDLGKLSDRVSELLALQSPQAELLTR